MPTDKAGIPFTKACNLQDVTLSSVTKQAMITPLLEVDFEEWFDMKTVRNS
jgi:hypothetical protein